MLHNNWYILHKNPQHNAVVVVLRQIQWYKWSLNTVS